MGGGFGPDGPDKCTYVAADLARQTGRPVKCALTRREENLDAGNRNATIQRLRAGARSDGTLTALEGEFVDATGWGGWLVLDGRADGAPLRLRERPARGARREAEHRADESVPRAGLRRGHVRARVPDGRAGGATGFGSAEARRRNHSDHDAVDGRPFSSKNLLECYTRAEPHWGRRRRYAPAPKDPGSGASGWRARSGTAEAVRPPTRRFG